MPRKGVPLFCMLLVTYKEPSIKKFRASRVAEATPPLARNLARSAAYIFAYILNIK